MTHSYNLGLRLVYRQEWRSIGNQRGEIVKVIPLAPKQVEKISTKITRRTRIAKNAESLKSTETTIETTDTTKDSTEVINEAATTHNWEIKADGSFNVSYAGFGVGGSVQGPSYGGSTMDKTTETSLRLNELVQKTASKLTTQTKVTISMESEQTSENAISSEIQNPNDEIALTYIYSKLQRQYEVFTSLAEVQNVIMVAEKIPKPENVNFHWVKRYDWIIAKVLLDDSFRDALNSISHEVHSPDQSIMTEQMKGVMDSTIEHLGSLVASNRSGNLSLSEIDVAGDAQRNYRETAKERIERLKDNYRIEQKRERLYQHIRENLLHYCGAIWFSEDPQQRILRYRKQHIKVYTEWWYKVPFGESGLSIFFPLDYLLNRTPDDEGNLSFDLNGKFVHGDEYIYLADLINPAGPIDYVGNYALYYPRPELVGSDIFGIFHILKAPYLYYKPKFDNNGALIGHEDPILMDPLLKKFKQESIPSSIGEDIKIQMSHVVPDLRLMYEDSKSRSQEPQNDEDRNALTTYWNNEGFFKRYYAEYRFRQERSNFLLLDTNNVVIDIEVGTGTTLEGFKLAHRSIDAMKALEEKKKLVLENERRKN